MLEAALANLLSDVQGLKLATAQHVGRPNEDRARRAHDRFWPPRVKALELEELR